MDLSRPSVFIFGAGATKGGFSDQIVSPPVDADFFQIAHLISEHGTNRLAQQVFREVFLLHQRTGRIGLEEYFRDIEARARIGSFAKAANQPKNWRNRLEQIIELVRRIYIQTTCESKDDSLIPKISKIHKNILAFKTKRHNYHF